MKRHNCREHIVRTVGPNGGHAEHHCGVCKRPVPLTLRRNQVLMRKPA